MYDRDDPRAFVDFEMRSGEFLEGLAAELDSGFGHDHRFDEFAANEVGDAEDRHVFHILELPEHVFHVGGEDVDAGGDDQVLLAVDDLEEAVGVAAGEVAGVEPAVAERAAAVASGSFQ